MSVVSFGLQGRAGPAVSAPGPPACYRVGAFREMLAVLVTALAQLRFAASLVFGVPFTMWSLDRLIDGIRETQREFGAVGSEGVELVEGPALDDETRADMQLRRFRTQAARAARETDYYPPVFERLGLDPARLRAEDITRIPLTPKEALRNDPDAFVRRSRRPYLRSMTTGTTGRPTSVYFSTYELQMMVALSAIAFLMSRQIGPEDIVQISTSARAVLGNLGIAGACARIGALAYLAGVIEAEQGLALLSEERRLAGRKPRTSVLSAYPSYLGQLVECGLRAGYRPGDFGLERIFTGGEVVTEGVKARCRELFGAVEIVESYAMSETLPFGGTRCAEGHLHFEVAHGLLEVLDPDTGAPALPGEAGTIVATPFPPFRDTTILLRYDTEDVVCPVAEPLTCSLRNRTATTDVLGKLRLSVRHEGGRTFPRDVLEALEADPAVPLPARCGFWAVPGGVAVEAAVRRDDPAVRRTLGARLEERGVPLRQLLLTEDPSRLRRPLPLRCDLKEVSFGPLPDGGPAGASYGDARPRPESAPVQGG